MAIVPVVQCDQPIGRYLLSIAPRQLNSLSLPSALPRKKLGTLTREISTMQRGLTRGELLDELDLGAFK